MRTQNVHVLPFGYAKRWMRAYSGYIGGGEFVAGEPVSESGDFGDEIVRE